jgi:hypothetical protein
MDGMVFGSLSPARPKAHLDRPCHVIPVIA